MQKLKSNGIPDRHLKACPLRWWPFLYARRFDGYLFSQNFSQKLILDRPSQTPTASASAKASSQVRLYYEISVSDESILTMTGASNKEWTDYIGSKPAAEDRKISLQVPDALLESLAISTTNEDITLPALAVTGQISLSTNGGSIAFETLDVGSALTLSAKNGDISGAVAGSYDDFSIQTEIKKGESNLPGDKDDGEKALRVSCNNGDVDIAFANGN